LNRLVFEERFVVQSVLAWSTWFTPLFLGFPSPAVGRVRQSEEVSEITPINKNVCLNREALLLWCGPLLNVETVNQPVSLNKVSQFTIPAPLQQRLVMDPSLKDVLRLLGPIAKTTHPVLIEPRWLTAMKLPQERTPHPRLPATQFMTIRCTHASSTDHSPEPWTGR
jgi:hypothetical protein